MLVVGAVVAAVVLSTTWPRSGDTELATDPASAPAPGVELGIDDLRPDEEAFTCPVTVPSDAELVPPAPWEGSPSNPDLVWYGSPDLWTALDKDEHKLRKSAWWSVNFPGGRVEEKPELEVIYTRLDDEIEPEVNSAPGTNAYTVQDGWFMINGLEPDGPGCWQAIATYKGATLSYVYELD